MKLSTCYNSCRRSSLFNQNRTALPNLSWEVEGGAHPILHRLHSNTLDC